MSGVIFKEETVEKKLIDFLTEFEVQFVSLVDHGANRAPFKIIRTEEDRAKWTTKYINNLPSSSFAVIETGYKDGESPKTARHLPFKDAGGKVDLPHLRNALARANQIKSVLGSDTDQELRDRAQRKLAPYAKKHLKQRRDDGIMYDVIQSVLIPSTSSLESLKEKLVWLHDMEVQRVEKFDSYTKFHHKAMDRFKDNSFYMEQLEGGALVLVGELIEADPSALTLRGDLSTPVGIDSQGFISTFGDIVARELNALIDNVVSTLSLSGLPDKEKKRSISNALSSFNTYISMGLDSANGTVQLRIDRPGEIKKNDEVVEMTQEVGVDEKVQEERIDEVLAKMLDERLDALIERVVERLTPPQVVEKVEEVREEEKVPAQPDTKLIDELSEKIKGLEERLAKFEEEDSSLPESNPPQDEITRSEPAPKPNIWRGVLLGNKYTA
jgi:hypothetical protein